MTSPDLGSAFTACPDDTPKGFQAVRDWIEACFREVGLDWNDYTDGVHGRIAYYDITAFHESDSDLGAEFLEIERRERNNKASYPG
jgi:hypothetical protein